MMVEFPLPSPLFFYIHYIKKTPNETPYLCMELARRLRASALWALASATRLARIWAYSFYLDCISIMKGKYCVVSGITHGLVLDLLGLAALESETVALVLQALGGDQSLDLGSLGVRLLALALGLDLSSDDVLADLFDLPMVISFPNDLSYLFCCESRHRADSLFTRFFLRHTVCPKSGA